MMEEQHEGKNRSALSTVIKVGLVLVLAVLTYLGFLYLLDSSHDTRFGRFIGGFIRDYGFLAVVVLALALDLIVSPFSPDIVILFSMSYGLDPVPVVAITTVASGTAGVIDFFIGKKLSGTALKRWIGKKNFDRGQSLYDKYGMWAVLVGGLTPVPYSPMCYMAGFFKMPLYVMVLTAFTTRMLRFIAVACLAFIWINQ